MRDFFIDSLEVLVGVIVVIMALVVVVAAGAVAFGGGQMMGPGGMSGPLAGVGILIGGALYVIFIGGFMYMGIGIYQNTRRSAEALEKLAAR